MMKMTSFGVEDVTMSPVVVEVFAFDHWGVGRSSVHNRKSDHQACKIAAMVPDRVLSLTGDFQCFPEESLAFSVFVWNMSTSKIIVRIGPYL
ncbi:hypothetical protein MTR_5g070950 [Medicago truncatula]|uniref:Uncharacterized protein n=1 Tax=Medicago truncatula TaxID=3880 RepID=G7KE94_MEDTR|nr:hypothetical protein MTR_5g070950 [Medicago truncatula]